MNVGRKNVWLVKQWIYLYVRQFRLIEIFFLIICKIFKCTKLIAPEQKLQSFYKTFPFIKIDFLKGLKIFPIMFREFSSDLDFRFNNKNVNLNSFTLLL